MHVYDEALARHAGELPWTEIRSGVIMPGIENVVRSAVKRRSTAPTPYTNPTLIVHDYEQKGACAQALGGWLASELADWYGSPPAVEVKRLPAKLQAVPNVVELWLPPLRREKSRYQ